MTISIHLLILSSIAIVVIAFVLAHSWVGSVDRRLTALEVERSGDLPE